MSAFHNSYGKTFWTGILLYNKNILVKIRLMFLTESNIVGLKLISSLDLNNIKNEDVMYYDEGCYGLVSGIAGITDGATGFLSDIDSQGRIIQVSDITREKYSSARVWAEMLSQQLLKNAKNEKYDLIQVLKLSIGEASDRMPIVTDAVCSCQTPSAAVILVRQCGDILEVIGSGDCCLIAEYHGGETLVVTGSAVLEKIRAVREAKILLENPRFDEMSPEEKAKIRFFYMRQTRETLGNHSNGYFVPFYQGDKVMDDFCEKIFNNEFGKINYLGKGDIWTLFIPSCRVKSLMLSSDGFIDKVLKSLLADVQALWEAGKTNAGLLELGKKLREHEMMSGKDVHARTMDMIQNKRKYGSADDAVALYFEVGQADKG